MERLRRRETFRHIFRGDMLVKKLRPIIDSVKEYSQVHCRLCGVSFNINRIRTAEELRDFAWGNGMRSGWVTNNKSNCVAEDGCSLVYRGSPHSVRQNPDLLDEVDEEEDQTYQHSSASDDEILEYDSDADDENEDLEGEESSNSHFEEEESEWTFRAASPTYDTEFLPLTALLEDKYDSGGESGEDRESILGRWDIGEKFEHIAGPGCKNLQGYHGDRISAEEMRGCHTVQCIVRKGDDWAPTSGDLEFERQGNYYLTGLSERMPSDSETIWETLRFVPARHGTDASDAAIDLYGDPDPSATALPFHPTCFEIFSQANQQAFGHVNIDDLMKLRDTACVDRIEFPIRESKDLMRARQETWECGIGNEYLAANPVFIPALKSILTSAISNDEGFSIQTSAFEGRPSTRRHPHSSDPLLHFPREVVYDILNHLDSRAIAALRLSSRAFEHLPISLWRKLVVDEMPWLYEAWSSNPEPYYWAMVDPKELREKQEAERKFKEKTQRQHDVIEAEMPGIFDEYTRERCERLELRPVKLPKDKTNWYKVYRDITVNWDRLKGLQNRKRIWGNMMQIMDTINWMTSGRVLKFHKFYKRRRWQAKLVESRFR